MKLAAAAATYSQPSKISSVFGRRPSRATIAPIGETAPRKATRRALATALATPAGSFTGDRSIQCAPSGKLSISRQASSRASDDLPMPPGPTIVTSRPGPSSSASRINSLSRPPAESDRRGSVIDAGGGAGSTGGGSSDGVTARTNCQPWFGIVTMASHPSLSRKTPI